MFYMYAVGEGEGEEHQGGGDSRREGGRGGGEKWQGEGNCEWGRDGALSEVSSGVVKGK